MPGRPDLVEPVLAWYAAHRRDLPWRAAGRTPWGVLVSEAMLQQTPVSRVLPLWEGWMARWPTPAALALASPADVLRAWGRLGYPRRALALHRAAAAIVERHGGAVPEEDSALRDLPGVGEYTAAAVRAFAFGQRSVVLDTNVRRVLARSVGGQAQSAASPTRAEKTTAADVVPVEAAQAAMWSVAVMELGALVCTATAPRCPGCPVVTVCAWHRAGQPPYAGPVRRRQGFAGTDRQVRGLLLAVLREHPGPVPGSALDVVWPDSGQRRRALDGLVTDGLVEPLAGGRYRLPELTSG